MRSVARKSRIARNALRDLTTLVVKNEYKFNIYIDKNTSFYFALFKGGNVGFKRAHFHVLDIVDYFWHRKG